MDEIPEEFKDGEMITQMKEKFSGEKKIETYIKGEKIGKGGFSTCYKLYNVQDKKIYAAKEIIKDKSSYDRIKNEIDIYEYLKHDNIVNQKEHFIYNDTQYLIFEFCENRDLSYLIDKRKKLKEIEVQYYITQLIQALIHLHDRNIVHRDLKLGNIFLTGKMELKLGDFGLAKKLSFRDEKISEMVGTPAYMAPEILENKGYSLEVDIWSLGVIMYYLIIGKLPFNKPNQEDIKSVSYTFPKKAIISIAAKSLIEQILVKDPKERPSLKQILRHDFFTLGRSIPRLIPKVFMHKDPSINYIRYFMMDADKNGIVDRALSDESTRLKDIIIEKEDENEENKVRTDIYVTKCHEIKKYGLGYQLSNNNFGVYFNDTTKIIYDWRKDSYHYIGNNEETKSFMEKDIEEIKEPKDLNKKCKILKTFQEVLTRDKNATSTISRNENYNDYERKDDGMNDSSVPVYVKKYYSYDKQSILIRLTNKDIQIYFLSGETILLSKEEKEVTFIKKNNAQLETLKYPLQEIMETQNYDIIRKMQYSKSLLERIITDDNRQ
jgi:polo-like kinase 1